MSNRNNITGDRLINKRLSKEGEDNWDRIFKKEGIKLNEEELANVEIIADIVQHHHDKKEKFNRRNIKPEIFTIPKEKHVHTMLPEYELDKSTGEVVKVDSKKLTDAFNGH